MRIMKHQMEKDMEQEMIGFWGAFVLWFYTGTRV